MQQADRILAQLHERVMAHLKTLRPFPWTEINHDELASERYNEPYAPREGRSRGLDEGSAVMQVTHGKTARAGGRLCCRLSQPVSGLPELKAALWRVSSHCSSRECPIGYYLMWTTAGRFCPSLAEMAEATDEPSRGLDEKSICFGWPREMSLTCGQQCVVCNDDLPYDCGSMDGYLCKDPLCRQHLIVFATAAHAWWALVGADLLPADLMRVVGDLLTRLVLPVDRDE